MDWVYFLHLLFFIFIVSIPLLPLNTLKWAIYIPTLIALGWVVFNGCVVTQKQKGMVENSFTLTVLRRFFPYITLDQTNSLLHFVMLFGTLVAGIRLRKVCVQ
jgi:uncharacterized membrane protein YGL010W